MELLEDQARCSLLCQHPSCWASNHRPTTKTKWPLPSQRSQRIPLPPTEMDDDADKGLPTQSIVNLLANYEPDARDHYPLDSGGCLSHERLVRSATVQPANGSELSAVQRANHPLPVQSSSTRLRAPAASPASEPSHSWLGSSTKPPHLGQVEVQEVYDMDDLHSNWKKTFKSQQYYVWVPRRRRGQGKVKQKGCSEQLPNSKSVPEPTPSMLPVRDVTEDMVPARVEWEREAEKMVHGVWPVIKKLQQKPPPSDDKSKTPRMPAKQETFQGIYELLDLPREVIHHILQYITERDLISKERLTNAIMDALPSLKNDSTEVSLAHSHVLKQKKVRLLDSQLKAERQTEPCTARQIYLLDVDVVEERNNRGRGSVPISAESPVDLDRTPASLYSKFSSRHKTLPDIKGQKLPSGRVPLVSLGLPEIQSGPQHRQTRPFNYSKQDMDFTLGVVSPHHPSPRPPSSSHTGNSQQSSAHVMLHSANSDFDERPSNRRCAEEEGASSLARPAGAVSPSQSHTVPLGDSAAMPREGRTAGRPLPQQATWSSQQSGPQGVVSESVHPNQSAVSKSKSHRSVRFAQDTSGAASGSTMQPSERSTGAIPGSANHYSAMEKTTSRSRSKEMIRVPTANDMASSSSFVVTPEPEPWPQVDEAQFDRLPTPLAPPGSAADTPPNAQSIAATADEASEKSGLSSALPKSATSRGGEAPDKQDKSVLRVDTAPIEATSPPPPPPSPESREAPAELHFVSEQTAVNILEELVETESNVTLSAKPPSNLDDISRIHTPVYTPQSTSTRGAASERKASVQSSLHPDEAHVNDGAGLQRKMSKDSRRKMSVESWRKESTQSSIHPDLVVEVRHGTGQAADLNEASMTGSSAINEQNFAVTAQTQTASPGRTQRDEQTDQCDPELAMLEGGLSITTAEMTPHTLTPETGPQTAAAETGPQTAVAETGPHAVSEEVTLGDTEEEKNASSRSQAADNSGEATAEPCHTGNAAANKEADNFEAAALDPVKALEPERSLSALSGVEMDLIVASGADSELEKRLAGLDQFDVTEDDLKDDLKKEYERLDRELN